MIEIKQEDIFEDNDLISSEIKKEDISNEEVKPFIQQYTVKQEDFKNESILLKEEVKKEETNECFVAPNIKYEFKEEPEEYINKLPLNEEFLIKTEVLEEACRKNEKSTHFRNFPRYLFSCSKCNYQILKVLKEHIRVVHKNKIFFRCDKCNYKNIQEKVLRKHRQLHTNKKCFKCIMCNYECINYNKFKQHVVNHGKKKFKYSCGCPFNNKPCRFVVASYTDS